MTDIFDLFEAGEYPDVVDMMQPLDAALAVAAISQAISLKRIADMLEQMQATGLAAPAVPTAGKRQIGGGTRAPVSAATRPRDEASMAAGRPIPDSPIPQPPGYVSHDGEGMPVDRMAEVRVVWRNGHAQRGAAQQFHWKWHPEKAQAHEVLYYQTEAPDPAQFASANPELNVPLERSTPGGE